VVGDARGRVGSAAEGLVGSGSGGWCLGSQQLIEMQDAGCTESQPWLDVFV
jgi:hypothetical protein